MSHTMKIQLAVAATLLMALFVLISSQTWSTETPWRISRPSPKGAGNGANKAANLANTFRPYVQPDPLPWHPPVPKPFNSSATTSSLPDRIIVLAKIEDQDAPWITSGFPEWQTAIQNVDAKFARLHYGAQRTDKGRIADAYLRYIIENYHNLPSTLVFLNVNPKPYDLPEFDKVKALQNLKVDYIQKLGFANLRCISKAGCTEHFIPGRTPPDEFRTLEVSMPKVWKEIFEHEQVPAKLATPSGAEFAVSRKQLKQHKVEDYLRYWTWLNKSSMDDDTTGLVFEYVWHIIFGRSAEYCTELESCECNLYGKCSSGHA